MANNPTLGFRVSPELMDWLREIRPRAGYEGTDLARAVLETVRAACGGDVPTYPFDITVSIALRDRRSTGTAHTRGTALATPKEYHPHTDSERRVAEPAPAEKQQGRILKPRPAR